MACSEPVILLIEDDENLIDLIEVLLAGEPYRLHTARNGIEGIELAESRLPGLILLDCVMPLLDGLETARRLRAGPRTRSIPIYFLTAKGMEDDVLAGRLAGGDLYLVKPFSPYELLALIRDHFRLLRPLKSA